MTTFPSDPWGFPSGVTVYRHPNAGRVSVFLGRQPLCFAGTDSQAAKWVWDQVERREDLWAELTKLERAMRGWCDGLSS